MVRERIDKLTDQGLPADVDRDEIDARLTTLQDQRLQLEFARVNSTVSSRNPRLPRLGSDLLLAAGRLDA